MPQSRPVIFSTDDPTVTPEAEDSEAKWDFLVKWDSHVQPHRSHRTSRSSSRQGPCQYLTES